MTMATDEATAAMTTDIDEEAETMDTTEEADVACVQTTLDGGIVTQTSRKRCCFRYHWPYRSCATCQLWAWPHAYKRTSFVKRILPYQLTL